MTIITMEPEEILRFIRRYQKDFLIFYQITRDTALDYIRIHQRYNTLVTLQDENGRLIAVTRFNVRGLVADCFDTVIHPRYRGVDTLKSLILKAWAMHPYLEYLQFERRIKYPNKLVKTYSIRKFLGE